MSQWIGAVGAVVLIGLLVVLVRAAGGAGEDPEKELFRLCRGDREMMDRLISLELTRGTNRNRKAAIKAAIYALKRDNR